MGSSLGHGSPWPPWLSRDRSFTGTRAIFIRKHSADPASAGVECDRSPYTFIYLQPPSDEAKTIDGALNVTSSFTGRLAAHKAVCIKLEHRVMRSRLFWEQCHDSPCAVELISEENARCVSFALHRLCSAFGYTASAARFDAFVSRQSVPASREKGVLALSTSAVCSVPSPTPPPLR